MEINECGRCVRAILTVKHSLAMAAGVYLVEVPEEEECAECGDH